MDKLRLELFSDGVFAIILTLLVIELELPHEAGLAGLREVMPTLLVHALVFLLVGMCWLFHNRALSLKTDTGDLLVRLNLLALFWPTLMPFAARIAARDPLEPLGAFLLAINVLAYTLSIYLIIAKTGALKYDGTALGVSLNRRLNIRYWSLNATGAICAALCFVSPWFGYGYVVLWSTTILFTRSMAEVLKHQQGDEPPRTGDEVPR